MIAFMPDVTFGEHSQQLLILNHEERSYNFHYKPVELENGEKNLRPVSSTMQIFSKREPSINTHPTDGVDSRIWWH